MELESSRFSNEGVWNTGRQENHNLGYKLRHKEGYFPAPPADTLQDLRSEIILKMEEVGVPVEVHHHEVGTAGQGEIDMKYAPLTKMAVTVLEADPVYVGGIARTVSYKGFRFDIGGHRFFSKSKEVEDFWTEILGDENTMA